MPLIDPVIRPVRSASTLATARLAQAPLIVSASEIQARIWAQHQLDPQSQHVAGALLLRGPLDLERLRRSLELLAERHDLLRTRFVWEDGGLKQTVDRATALELALIDLRGLPQARLEAEVARRTALERGLPFDPANGPLWRSVLFMLRDEEQLLLLASHASIADLRSVHLILRELLAGYARPAITIDVAPEVRPQAQLVRAFSFDDERLSGFVPLDLKPDHTGSTPSTHRGVRCPLSIAQPLHDALLALCQRHGVDLELTLLTVFEILLHRHTGQTDFGIGVAHRDPYQAACIGPLTDVLPLRTELAAETSGLECLHRVGEANQAARARSVPYAERAEALSISTLPPALFAYQDRPALPPMESLEASHAQVDFAAISATLSLQLFRDTGRDYDRLSGFIEYDRELFDAPRIARMAEHFLNLIRSFTHDPSLAIGLLPMVGEDEQRQLLALAQGPSVDTVPNVPIHALIEAMVDRAPSSIALAWDGGSWTYAELDRRSNQLARHLAQLGVEREMKIPVYVDRSPEMLVAILGVLKAGGTYVPLDTSYPPDRLARVLGHTKASIILTQSALLPRIPEGDHHIICLDIDWATVAAESRDRPRIAVSPDQLAYVIYTSGSTGNPKGVMIEHRQLVHYTTHAANAYSVSPSDRVLQFASVSFDASVEEIFCTLTKGAALVLRRHGALQSVSHFLAQCAEDRITVLSLPTAYWHEVTAALARDRVAIPECLRLMIIGGEQASASALAAWNAEVGQRVQLLNTYGPSETTVVTTIWDAAPSEHDEEMSLVPIGRPIANSSAYVLDSGGQIQPFGVPGELHIGGGGVSRGYLGSPDLTRERFSNDPFSSIPGARLYRTGDRCRMLSNGILEFLGRDDGQLKINGHRIELSEIEARLNEHPAVEGAAIAARTDTRGETRLFAYVVPRSRATLNENQLRSHLARWLVPHLIPSIVVIDALPKTINGKIDRRALPEPTERTTEGPRNPIEQILCDAFSEVLPNRSIGIRDDFFVLGGDSLGAVELVSILTKRLEIEIGAHQLYEHRTVEALAAAVLAQVRGEIAPRLATIDLHTEVSLEASIRPRFPYVISSLPPSDVFLTGATGFFGAFLLAELLQSTQTRVHCLVRALSPEEAQSRLLAAWTRYFGSRVLPLDRVVMVPGDLARPQFSLSDEAFRKLANSVGAIYHAGASVNYLMPYSELRAANVLGTEEVLRLAAMETPKPVHHVSSLAVFGSNPSRVDESTLLEPSTGLGGYPKSKWVAEKLVERAREVGIPAVVYRLGRLTGHASTGVSNASDMLVSLIEACVELGAAPDLDLDVDIVPVDFAATSLVALSRRSESLHQAFHIGHPRPIAWSRLIDSMESFGYRVRRLSHESWIAALEHYAADRQAAKRLLFIGNMKLDELRESLAANYDCRATVEALADGAVAPPVIDDALLHAGFEYLVQTGLLPPPKGRA